MGFKFKADNLQAAFLDHKLKVINKTFQDEDKSHQCTMKVLSIFKSYLFQSHPAVEIIDVFQNYELRAEKRDELKKFLSDNGIGSIIQWAGTPVHQFKKLGFNNKDLTFTDKFFEKCLMLPMNMGISDNEVKFVIDKINEFYK